MLMAAAKAEIAIVGGGILGVVLANEVSAAGFRPIVFRLSDQDVPFADSFRNQAWLQSGLRYVRHNPELALRMWTYGRRLHEALGIPVPNGRGVFQLHSPGDVATFLEDAQRLGVSSEVKELSSEQAHRLLDRHHQRGSYAYSTPESTFDEAKLIRRAREQAERRPDGRNAVFCELSKPVEIIPLEGRSPSHRLRVNGKEMEFAATILAAGAGNIPLLGSLQNQVGISIEQTPLLVLPGEPTIRTPILVERSRFSLIAHPPGSCRTDGCMVFAADVHESIDFHRPPSERKVSPHKRQDLLDAVPTPLKSRLNWSRITAGWELSVVRDGVAQPTTEPFIDLARGYDDIVIAMPGRATLALYAAERVLEILKRRPRRAKPSHAPPDAPWNPSSIRMHHEEYYDPRLND